MRFLLLTSLMTLAAGPALAQSAITVLAGSSTSSGNSIQSIHCAACRAEIVEADSAPDLGGASIVKEAREVAGETRIYRTDNLWGGSPVTTVATAKIATGMTPTPEPMDIAGTATSSEPVTISAGPAGSGVAPAPVYGNVGTMPLDIIDMEARTSGIDEPDAPAIDPIVAGAGRPKMLDADGYELRLN